jgi:hypothetical protein
MATCHASSELNPLLKKLLIASSAFVLALCPLRRLPSGAFAP